MVSVAMFTLLVYIIYEWSPAVRSKRIYKVDAYTAMLFGVQQESALGPIIFVLFTTYLLQLVETHGLQSHLYANTQIYSLCRPGYNEQLQVLVSACGHDVGSWMRSNRLQLGLHTSKTEVLWFASVCRQHQIPDDLLTVALDLIPPDRSICDLGISTSIDSDLSMRTHVTRTVSSCFAVLRPIRSISRSVLQSLIMSLASHTSWPFCSSVGHTAVGVECRHAIGFWVAEVLRCDSTSERSALAACSGTYRVSLAVLVRVTLSAWNFSNISCK